jgi:undecaprenyl-diphosphatase
MTLVQLIVLAIIQGITEFLPISSSAHLILAPLVVDGWDDQGPLIDIAAHVGSLIAVLIYFRSETGMLFRGGIDAVRLKQSDDRKLFFFIAAATIPLLVAAGAIVATGALDYLRTPVAIGVASIVFGALLWHGDTKTASFEGLGRITWREAMLIGAAQALALIPGASRSGVTMTAARYLGWTREEAARFSMLLAIPAISALGLFAAIEMVREGASATMSAAAIVAVLSFLTAYASIAALMALTRRISFAPFAIYRILMGILLLAFAAGAFG